MQHWTCTHGVGGVGGGSERVDAAGDKDKFAEGNTCVCVCGHRTNASDYKTSKCRGQSNDAGCVFAVGVGGASSGCNTGPAGLHVLHPT